MRLPLEPRVEALTEKIIAAAFAALNVLGHGFMEVVYRNALVEELVAYDIHGIIEKPYPVHYRSKVVGRYVADLVMEDTVIVEVKAIDTFEDSSHSGAELFESERFAGRFWPETSQ